MYVVAVLKGIGSFIPLERPNAELEAARVPELS